MKNNNFKQFLAMLLCITLIPVTPIAYADEGSDSLKNSGEALGGLNFGGGARPEAGNQFSSTATVSSSQRSQSLAKANLDARTAARDKKTTANLAYNNSSLEWLDPKVLSKAKEEEKKVEVIKTSPIFSLQSEANKGSQLLNAFKMNISALLGVIRNEKEEKPGFDLEETVSFAEASKNFETTNDASDKDIDAEIAKLFPTFDEIDEETLTATAEKEFTTNDSDAENQEEVKVVLPSLNQENVMDALIASGDLPKNYAELMATNFVSAPGPEATAETLTMEMNINTDIDTPGVEGEDGYWKEIEVINPAVLAQIAALEIELAMLNAERANLQNELAGLDADIASLDEQINRLNERIANLQTLIDQLNDQLARIQQGIDELQARIDEKQREYNFLEFQWNGLLNRNIALDQMARALWAELHGNPRPSAARRREIVSLRADMRREFNENRRNMNDLRNQGLRLARAIRDLERQKASRERAKARVQERLNNINNTMDRLKTQRDQLLAQKAEKEQRRTEIQNRMAEIDNRVQEIQDQIAELMKNLYMKIWIWVPGTRSGNDSESEEEEPTLEDPSTDHSLVQHELVIDVEEPHSV